MIIEKNSGENGIDLEAKIAKFRKFAVDEIDIAIKEKANYLAALGLSAHTEFLGGLYRFKLEERNSKQNYDEGLKRLGSEYNNLLKKHCNVYDRIRCGLVHEFFIKGTAIIWLEKQPQYNCGIEFSSDDCISFYARKYFEDYKKAVDAYIEEMKKNSKLSDYFLNKCRVGPTFLMSGVTTLPSENSNSCQILDLTEIRQTNTDRKTCNK